MDWQPIETAPKDGTRILVSDGEDVFVAKWDWINMRGQKGWQTYCYVANEYNYYDDCSNPTKWMPLPQP